MDENDEKPIGEVLGNIRIGALPDGYTPLDALVLVKCMDGTGNSTWVYRMTDGMNDEEILGALTIQTAMFKQAIVDAWDDEDSDD